MEVNEVMVMVPPIELLAMYFLALTVELIGIVAFVSGLRQAKGGERLRLIGSLLIVIGSLIWAKVVPILIGRFL